MTMMMRSAMRDGLSSLQNLSGDDILAAIGLEKRRTVVDAVVPSLAIFAAGALVGAAAAVLLTPKSGPQMRRELTDGARDLSQKLQSTAQEYTGTLRQQTGNASSSSASHA
jgi:hypothetical protein